jgi:uncharacterized membrane protein
VSTSTVLVILGTFLASAVEMVEALTIVLGVGIVRGWRSTLIGVGAALIVLAALVAALGPALSVVPIETLRLIVGALLLAFGLQWLRKAILRSSGYTPLHDEDAAFRRHREEAAKAGRDERAGLDWYSFTVAFKGVLLEGLEVVFIVLTFGANQHNVPLAAAGAVAAAAVVAAVGVAVRAPLSRVPENTLKFVVGVLLTAFGIFWGAEGAGARWPGSDLALIAVIAGVLGVALAAVAWLGRVHDRRFGPAPRPADHAVVDGGR